MRPCAPSLALFLTLPGPMALACGIATHGEVVQRASHWFDSPEYPQYETYVAAHQDALQAGASFPDWGYACGFDDAAEEAHWNPFLMAAAQYVHDTYPKPWDEETEKLAVFLLSVTTHSVADISWHGLGVDEGFIDVISDQEFEGDWGRAHTWADTGGDMVATQQLDLDYLTFPWYVPVTDLVKIYHEMGYEEVSPGWVMGCTYLMFLGAVGERIGGQAIYPHFANESAFLAEGYTNYFAGGLDDMAIHSAWMWDDVIDWMETGDTSRQSDTSRLVEPLDWEHDNTVQTLLDSVDTRGVDIDVEKTDRGVYLRMVDPVLEVEKASRQAPRITGGGAQLTFNSGIPYAYTGTALANGDFDGDGRGDLAIGAPGTGEKGLPHHGRVFVWRGGNVGEGNAAVDLNTASFRTYSGTQEYTRFGEALAVVDLNLDGRDDLAVGAPTLGSRDLNYYGRVYVYFGTSTGLSTSAGLIINGDAVYQGLGRVLAGADADGDGKRDLIIGAPTARAGGTQRGEVAIFLGRTGGWSGTVSVNQANLRLGGVDNWGEFGSDLVVTRAPSNQPLLLVSAPGATSVDNPAAGRIFAFDLTGIRQGASHPTPVFTLEGVDYLDHAGASLAVGQPYGDGVSYLAISTPSRDQGDVPLAGGVALYALADLQGTMFLQYLVPRVEFMGDVDYGRLGWQVAFADTTGDGIDDLWMSEPLRPLQREVEAGQVYHFAGGKSFPGGQISHPSSQSDFNWVWQDDRSHFGTSLTFVDLDNDGILDPVSSAIVDSASARVSGTVAAYLSGTLPTARVGSARGPRP